MSASRAPRRKAYVSVERLDTRVVPVTFFQAHPYYAALFNAQAASFRPMIEGLPNYAFRYNAPTPLFGASSGATNPLLAPYRTSFGVFAAANNGLLSRFLTTTAGTAGGLNYGTGLTSGGPILFNAGAATTAGTAGASATLGGSPFGTGSLNYGTGVTSGGPILFNNPFGNSLASPFSTPLNSSLNVGNVGAPMVGLGGGSALTGPFRPF